MRLRIASLIVICLAVAIPGSAQQDLYDNGPINGTTNAWTINFGYFVGDSFIFLNNSTMSGFNFGVWEFPGDVMTSLQWSVTTEPGGGIVEGSGTASGKNLTDQFISLNQYGYDIDKITVTGLNLNLAGGTTYWLILQNAMVPSGDPIFWDENSGIDCGGDNGKGGGCPSQTYVAEGTIPSESFTIDGTGSGTTPEPSDFVLFGSGILIAVGILRRKVFRS